jgi:hypothetical protein
MVEEMIDSLIVFIFLGHSQMMNNGGCKLSTDTSILVDQRIYCFSKENGMHHYFETAPVMSFLNSMSYVYPGYSFCGVNCGMLSGETNWYKQGNNKYELLIKAIDSLKDKGIFGGIIMQLGFNEGSDSIKANKLCSELLRVIWDIRYRVGNSNLPCMVQRLEINNARIDRGYYRLRYQSVVSIKIDSMLIYDKYVVLYPIRNMGKHMYQEGDHHYNCEGIKHIMEDAAALYQINKFDWWKK